MLCKFYFYKPAIGIFFACYFRIPKRHYVIHASMHNQNRFCKSTYFLPRFYRKRIFNKLFAQLYEQNQGAGAGPDMGGAQTAQDAGYTAEDDVVDGDFREV